MKYIILIIIIAVACFCILQYTGLLKPKSAEAAAKSGRTGISANAKVDFLIGQVLLQSHYSTLPVEGNINAVDSSGRSFSLKDVFDKKKVVVYRISELNCMECIKAQFPFLKKLADKVGTDHVMLLSSFASPKSFKIFLQNLPFVIRAYNVPLERLSALPIESLNVPYFFESEYGSHFDYVFIPRKEMPELSEEYCAEVIRNFN